MQQCIRRGKVVACKFIKIAVYSCHAIVYNISVATNNGAILT